MMLLESCVHFFLVFVTILLLCLLFLIMLAKNLKDVNTTWQVWKNICFFSFLLHALTATHREL